MRAMKLSIKGLLIIFALPLLFGLIILVVLRSGPDERSTAIPNSSPGSPSFEVRVIVPRLQRAFGGILPDWVVKKIGGTVSEVRIDHTSPGAKIGSVENDRLQLSADEWDVLIETDGGQAIAPETRIVFPIDLGGRHVRLRCRPADQIVGHLHTNTSAGSNDLNGEFLVELARCENADSGRTVEWPSRPLTLRGNFAGLHLNRR
jgi:hypothetical protein